MTPDLNIERDGLQLLVEVFGVASDAATGREQALLRRVAEDLRSRLDPFYR